MKDLNLQEILEQKEFYQLKYNFGPKLPINRFKVYTQQLFTARWMIQPGVYRCFLKHSMGSGKTIGSLLSAAENHEIYKFLGSGRVIIIGFQKETFLREILSKPELGYITQEEFRHLRELEKNTSEAGRENYKKYRSSLKKRISDSTQGGFVKFIGYKELYNLIYVPDHNDDKKKKKEVPNPSEEILKLFEDSFLICDEIHNVYNSLETNSYGKALRYILDRYDKNIKVLFMSGTPINNKPSEIVDILNLIIPLSERKKDYVFSDFFSMETDKDSEMVVEKLLPGSLEKIGLLSSGYFSFFINEDISFMPAKRIESDIKLDYMGFIKCEPSEEHKKILRTIKNIGLDDHNILDAYFPLEDSFFYKNSDFILVNSQPEKWKQKMGIYLTGGTITGNILLKENLKQYSGKYARMLEDLDSEGKIMIYHEFINGTGLKLIEQILIVNGILPINGIITPNTKCSKCFNIFSKHSALTKNTCDFEAARFISLYGELDKKTIDQNMLLFNSNTNAEGYKYKYLLGSSMIREGYDFKCIREIWVMHLLPHISAYLQLEGRAIRAFSHDALPLEKRNVTIKVFAINEEIKRYKPKLENYKIIQQIDRKINENAIDVSIYYNIIKKSFVTNSFGHLEFPEKKRVTKINDNTYNTFYGDWEVEEIKKLIAALFILTPVWSYKDLFDTVRHPPFEQLVDCSLFQENNFILALGDMVYGYMNFPIVKEGRPFKICYSTITSFSPSFSSSFSSSFSPGEKEKSEKEKSEKEKSEKEKSEKEKSEKEKSEKEKSEKGVYILYPLEQSKDQYYGKKLDQINGITKINFLNWIQQDNSIEEVKVDITEELISLNTNYEEMRKKFIIRFKNASMLEIPVSTEVFGIQFHIRLIEEAIEYIFNILTKKDTRSEFHDFYFKIIHFYNKLDLIIYANNLPSKYDEIYNKFSEGEADTNTLLVNHITNSSSSISSFEISEINNFLETKKKVPKNILPVGHILSLEFSKNIEPKLFTPAGWFYAKSFYSFMPNSEKVTEKENDIIIGYYERSENSIDFKFKLRTPSHLIVTKKDKREMESGMVCESKHKNELVKIASALNLSVSGTNKNICLLIKEYLLHMELKNRNKYRKGKITKRIRWCYLPYEQI